jgi:predicted transcriptional regulator
MIALPKDPAASRPLQMATYRLTPELIEALKKCAEKRKTSQSAIVRGVLAAFLAKAH